MSWWSRAPRPRLHRPAPLQTAVPRRFYNRPRYERFGNTGGGDQGGSKTSFDFRSWPIQVGAGIGAFGGLYYVSHLETVPISGRRRFMNVSEEEETAMRQVVIKQVMDEYQGRLLPQEHPLTKHVKRVARRIITANELGRLAGEPKIHLPDTWDPLHTDGKRDREWVVLVVNYKTFVNAFAAPGVVCVSTGILPICKDEQGLAAVLGHEIGHVALRHTAEKISGQGVGYALVALLAILGLDFGISAVLKTVLLELPNSRALEREADLIGIRMMAKACYEPSAAPQMFARLNELEGRMASRLPQFLNTHPATQERVDFLQSHLPEANDILAGSPDCHSIRDHMDKLNSAFAKRINISDLTTQADQLPQEEVVWR